MQIRKVYYNLSPELLYSEIRELAQKQGFAVGASRLETFSVPADSSSFIYSGTLTFKTRGKAAAGEKDCLVAHVVGSVLNETKLLLDIDEKLFSQDRVNALKDDLDFIFKEHETKPE